MNQFDEFEIDFTKSKTIYVCLSMNCCLHDFAQHSFEIERYMKEKKRLMKRKRKKKHDQELKKFNNIQRKLSLKKREHLKVIVLKTKKTYD